MILHPRPAGQAHPRLGAHMSIAGGLARAIDRAVATGCEAVQIFSKSSNQWRSRALTDTEVGLFRQRVAETEVEPIVAHASYLINLASPDPTLRRRSTDALEDELQRANSLGLAGVVLHPGAYTTSSEAEGLARIADAITDVLARHPPGSANLLLEQTAGQGTVLGHRFDHLRSIIDRVDDASKLGVCLDTCHLVAAGYDIISPDGYVDAFDEFEAVVGLDRLKLFHLNDSKQPLGSRVDRHETIGRGYIGTEPFGRLLRDDRFRNLPMVLETPKSGHGAPSSSEADPMDIQNLTLLRQLR
jgi:deoxyribonuclease-4